MIYLTILYFQMNIVRTMGTTIAKFTVQCEFRQQFFHFSLALCLPLGVSGGEEVTTLCNSERAQGFCSSLIHTDAIPHN